jgi:hypothetical protein
MSKFMPRNRRGRDDPRLAPFELNDFGIGGVIFQKQDPQWLIHTVSSLTWIHGSVAFKENSADYRIIYPIVKG